MNKINQFKKRLLIFGIVALFLIALPVTIYLVRQQQNLQQKASEAPSVFLDPSTVPVAPNDDAQFTLKIKPGNHSVKHFKIVLDYNNNKLRATDSDFQKDSSLKLDKINKNIGNGKAVIEFGTSTPSNYIQSETTIGAIKFKAIGDAGDTPTIRFDDATEIKGPNAGGDIVVFSDFSNPEATVQIAAGICVPNQSTCSWSAVDGADYYKVKVLEEGNDTPLVDEAHVTDTKVTFISQNNKTYTCEVIAANDCGNSTDKKSTQQKCGGPTGTVTLTPTLTLTPTVVKETNTPTPTTKVTNTPTPTTPVGSTETPTPTGVTFVTTTPTTPVISVITSTPIPTLPPTGGNVATFGAAVAGALIIVGGLLLLIL